VAANVSGSHVERMPARGVAQPAIHRQRRQILGCALGIDGRFDRVQFSGGPNRMPFQQTEDDQPHQHESDGGFKAFGSRSAEAKAGRGSPANRSLSPDA
jgi:hypothetical protein